MWRLGLTGGIGSGKSTVARSLVALGAVLIDADAVSRAMTAAGGAAIAAITSEFGPEFVDSAGALDRDRMRALAFSDPAARGRLERIVHPLVGEEMATLATDAVAAGARSAVLDIPLLVEFGHWAARLDRVLVVDCTAETQIARVMARSGLARETAEGIIASQATRAQRLAAADAVIFNDGLSLEQLDAETRQVARLFGL